MSGPCCCTASALVLGVSPFHVVTPNSIISFVFHGSDETLRHVCACLRDDGVHALAVEKILNLVLSGTRAIVICMATYWATPSF